MDAAWPHPTPPRVGSTVTLGVAGQIGPVVGKVTGFRDGRVWWDVTDPRLAGVELDPVMDPDGLVHLIMRDSPPTE